MKYLKSWLTIFVLLVGMPCLAAVVSSVAVPTTRAAGSTITASIWNADVGGIYTYINNNIVPVLNLLTTKGDIYVFDGSALQRLGVGADNTCLISNSGAANGIQWSAVANTTPLTTKGDLLGYSSAAGRLPVGTNGQVLIADSTQAFGLRWGTPTTATPAGSIIAWSPTFAGTNTIPSGWTLCDGTAGSPNLIGRFILGTKPTGSTATAAAGGFGYVTVDTTGGSTSHTHSFSGSGSTGAPNAQVAADTGAGSTAHPFHAHSFSFSGTTASSTLEPADYTLVYIMKL